MQQRHSTPGGCVSYPVEGVDEMGKKARQKPVCGNSNAIMRKGGTFVQSVAKMPQYRKTELRLIFLVEGFREVTGMPPIVFFNFLP
jgi:hypothetical protein